MPRFFHVLLLSLTPVLAQADNIVRITAPIYPTALVDAEPLVGDWVQVGSPRNCSAWTPLASSYPTGVSFTQSALCDIDQQRQVQDRKYKSSTHEYVNMGAPRIEDRVLASQAVTQLAQGTGVAPPGGCVAMGSNGYWMENRNGSKLHSIRIGYKNIEVKYGETPVYPSAPTVPETTRIKDGAYTYTRGAYSHQVNTSYGGNYPVVASYYGVCQN